MNAQPIPPPGAYRRSLVDQDLVAVFADLKAARAANHQARCSTHRTPAKPDSDSTRLLTALRACVTALERHGLPIPPAIRDEIRLRRQPKP